MKASCFVPFFSLFKLVMPVLLKSWVLVLQLYCCDYLLSFLSELAKLACVFFLLLFYPSLFHTYRIMTCVQEKYEEAMASLAQMENRAVMAETMLEATLQYQSSQQKALSPCPSPRYINLIYSHSS
jgi:hypothetical protein